MKMKPQKMLTMKNNYAMILTCLAASLMGAGCDTDASKEAALLEKASAAIKVPVKLDEKTTLIKVWMPEKLTQEFQYEIDRSGLAQVDEGFEAMFARAKKMSCMKSSHVVKHHGKVRYIWMMDGKIIKERTIESKDCK